MAKISSCHMWPLHLEKGVCRRRLLAADILDRMFVVEGLGSIFITCFQNKSSCLMIESRFFTGYILRAEMRSQSSTPFPLNSSKSSLFHLLTNNGYCPMVGGPLFIILPNNEEVMGKHSIDRYSATDCCCCQRE